MNVELYTDSSAFEKLKPEWNDLLHRGVSDTLFLTWEWQSTWWQHLGSGKLRIVALRGEDGALLGLAPLFEEATAAGLSLSLVGCVDVSDYLDLIVDRAHADAVYAAFLDALTAPDFAPWTGGLHLCTVPESSPTNDRLVALAQARRLAVTRQIHDVCPVIDLPATWDAYLETLGKKDRHEIRRKLRRVEETNHRWYAVDETMSMEQAIADFVDLHRKSRPDKHLFMDSRMQGFFLDMARRLQSNGNLELDFLEIEGVRAATVLNFIYGDQVLVYNSGYDPVEYGQYSPGVVLFACSIRDAIAGRRQRYDFLRGNEEYKYRFGARDTQVFEIHIQPA
ncbi:MAG: GNAT family N-acetyltransferase [Chloroflexi bacterium]|nr:GNAT family N-acetyltransferase [Chloroflexota bacterium]